MSKKVISLLQCLLSFSILITGCSKELNTSNENPKNSPTISTNTITTNESTVTKNKRYVDPIFSEVEIKKDIIYDTVKSASGNELDLTLDLYEPKDDTEQNRPVIVFIHGGGFQKGNKNDELMSGLAKRFAQKGYVTMSINYRLSSSPFNFSGALDDAASDATAAIDWLKANKEEYRIDSDHIAVCGHSAGAIISLALGYRSSNTYQGLMAVISLSGLSASLDLSSDSPPCILIHGTRDQTIAYYESEAIAYQLTKNDIYNELYPLDADHSLGTYKDEIDDVTTKHLYYILTGEEIDIPIRTVTLSKEENIYYAKQVNLNIDGNLEEWETSEHITLNHRKDTGDTLPEASDFTGDVMLGYNESDPNRIYFAATITDDIAQYNRSEFWENDTTEIMFNLLADQRRESVVRWVLSTDGETLYPDATDENTEWNVVHNGNKYMIEAALDLTIIPATAPSAYRKFVAEKGIRFSMGIQYNDGENDKRESQVGWIFGSAWDQETFGTVILE